MAGGAADCAYWIRAVSSFSRKIGFSFDTILDTKAISYILSSILKSNRGNELSVGTMIAGVDKYNHHNYRPSIYYVDSEGVCINGELFCVGSGAPFAYAILDYYRLQHNSNDNNDDNDDDTNNNNVASLKTSRSSDVSDSNYNSNDYNDDSDDNSIRKDHARIDRNKAYMKGLSKLSVDDAIAVAIKAVRHATYRDGYSGGYINAFVINSTGIHHVQRVDSKTIKIGGISLQTMNP
jgi:20S proteasome alpha/beta subunit